MPASLAVTEFTDPACPFAFSAEPYRLRMQWLYADHDLQWRRRMIVLTRSPEEYAAKGLTAEMLSAGAAQLAEQHGMPIDTGVRPRLATSFPACTAVVAARLHAPEREGALLRALRLRGLGEGGLLDDPDVLAAAATDAGLDPADVARWSEELDVKAAVEEDATAARHPAPAALALDGKLAPWEGGRRYTAPSYEFTPDGNDAALIAVPGFQPMAVYEVVLANLLPDAAQRPDPESVAEVLEWAGEPLATQEVAVVCGLSRDEAAEQLAPVAERIPLGSDALWRLA